MAAPDLPGVRVEADGRVGRLTLCRPERRNALGYPQLQALVDAAAWFDARPDVGVVVVAGAGPSFCGGFDVRDPGPPPPGGADAALDLGRVAMNAIGSMRAVTVARVQGAARGGGVVLTLSCDLAVAALDARLALPESHMGMPIPWATLPRLVRALGPMRAKELVLAAAELDGASAAAVGLVTRAVAAEALDAAVDDLVAALLASPNLVLHEVTAEIERLAEAVAPTSDGAGDVDRMKRAHRDPGCRRRARPTWPGGRLVARHRVVRPTPDRPPGRCGGSAPPEVPRRRAESALGTEGADPRRREDRERSGIRARSLVGTEVAGSGCHRYRERGIGARSLLGTGVAGSGCHRYRERGDQSPVASW